ncbi:MAG: hypothetical protein IJO67_00230 [Clostridia bacterium]|nr:hypothetical protein [Clostridia bacterium]
MRKILALLLMISLVFTMTGCSQKESTAFLFKHHIDVWLEGLCCLFQNGDHSILFVMPNGNRYWPRSGIFLLRTAGHGKNQTNQQK